MTYTLNKQDALDYHKKPVPGKIATAITKPFRNGEDMSLAYSPGVAYPCMDIHENPELVFDYTTKGNLVGVISNGTAVLGLGDIGPIAAKPVMEGKAMLFKHFAGIDVFDIEISETDPEKFIDIVAALEPTFGGINLEDIKAPECFVIEEALKKRLSIPVFHDDQHGTAVIAAAGLKNALFLTKKELSDVRIIFSGAGSAAIAIANLLIDLGAKKERIFMYDSKGLLSEKRDDLNEYKRAFAVHKEMLSFADGLVGADVFIGVSTGDILSKAMVASMNNAPIIFALANPNPEILPAAAIAAAPDAIVATGRSDFPNQVNNVLGFPYMFRGALDTRATEINKDMKLAAVRAIADLAREAVPEKISALYGTPLVFGSAYIIPKPFDPRLLPCVSTAVAKAAMDSGAATRPIVDMVSYEHTLTKKSAVA
jgi:malate dehydrogenase (oxaloacetate-decarboxylating)(NADP+)